ncbi:hypothetical protein D0Y65_053390, partial [Glycine soja]
MMQEVIFSCHRTKDGTSPEIIFFYPEPRIKHNILDQSLLIKFLLSKNTDIPLTPDIPTSCSPNHHSH